MDCPVLTELRLTEGYEPAHENPPHLSGGDYDIDAIQSCGEGCKMAADNARLREALKMLQAISCDPAGAPCFEGSDGDRDIARTAFAALEGK